MYLTIWTQVPGNNVVSYVLDCEAVAWDKKNKCILPFQVLQSRKRKDVSSDDVTVCVCLFAFDLLYLNGEALTQSTFSERRRYNVVTRFTYYRLMHENFHQVDGVFQYATSMDGKSIDDIQVGRVGINNTHPM